MFVSFSDADLVLLADNLRPFIEKTTKLEMAPWVKAYTVDMDKLYTDSVLDGIENTPSGEELKPITNYRALFLLDPTDIMGKKVLVTGDPGKGKSTFVKKIAWDWSRGAFVDITLVLVVQLKLVGSDDTIESIIIQQCPPLEGLKISEKKLRNILDTFGKRCLLILDGLDEYDGKNEDVWKIIRGQKFYHCNVLLTSRPHCIGEVEENGYTVVTVQGFTKEKSEAYADNVLGPKANKDSVQKVSKFYDDNMLEGDTSYTCPRLLLFLGTLVSTREIDLTGKHPNLGEINTKLVGSLYRKFLTQKGIKSMDMKQFVKVLIGVGKIAFQILKSGRALLKKSDVIEAAGAEAFEYGLLIGTERYSLFPDETADISITFPYRTIQEFLGSLFFIQSLNDGVDIGTLLGTDNSEAPLVLTNPLFLYFCLWLTSGKAGQFKFDKRTDVLDYLKTYILDRINVVQLDFDDLGKIFPALDIDHVHKMKAELRINLLEDVLPKCDKTNDLMVTRRSDSPRDVAVLSFGSRMQNLRSVTLVDDRPDVITTDVDVIQQSGPEDFNVVISCREEIDIEELLTDCVAPDKQACVQMVVKGDELDLSEVAKGDIKQLNLINSRLGRSRLLCNSGISFCPSLTRLTLTWLDIDKSVVTSLPKAAQTGNLESVSQLRLVACKGLKGKLQKLFQNTRWPHLTDLDLHKCDLDMNDIQVLSNIPSDPSTSTLPRLTSLALSLDCIDIMKKKDLLTLFHHRWTRLSSLSLHGVPHEGCSDFYKTFTQETFPSLQKLHMSTNVGLNIEGLSIGPTVTGLTLNHFSLEADFSRLAQTLVVQTLTNLNLSHCSGIRGNLTMLLSKDFPSLSTLILSGCVLSSQDFSHLAEASVNGRLPELKHLDVSHNIDELQSLFDYFCKWERLERLNIENQPNTLSGLAPGRSSLGILAVKVRAGCLGSLRELRFTTRGGNYYPKSTRNLRWGSLNTLRISHAGTDGNAVLEPIADAAEDGQFPVLSVVRVSCKLSRLSEGLSCRIDSEDLAKVRFRLRERGVRVFCADNYE